MASSLAWAAPTRWVQLSCYVSFSCISHRPLCCSEIHCNENEACQIQSPPLKSSTTRIHTFSDFIPCPKDFASGEHTQLSSLKSSSQTEQFTADSARALCLPTNKHNEKREDVFTQHTEACNPKTRVTISCSTRSPTAIESLTLPPISCTTVVCFFQ